MDDYPIIVGGARSILVESIDRENVRTGGHNREVNNNNLPWRNGITGGIFHNRVLTRRDCLNSWIIIIQGVFQWVAADLNVILGELETRVRSEPDLDRVSYNLDARCADYFAIGISLALCGAAKHFES